MGQLSRAAPIGLPQALMRSRDRVALQSKHVRAAAAEFRLIIEGEDPWQGAPISLANVPIYVMTSGTSPPLPGKTDAERNAMCRAWYDLHAQLLAASTSAIRRHDLIADAPHYLQRARPGVVLSAARELLRRIESEPANGRGRP
jgi:pimeloyl-ACP methyl ester carboxylesterase